MKLSIALTFLFLGAAVGTIVEDKNQANERQKVFDNFEALRSAFPDADISENNQNGVSEITLNVGGKDNAVSPRYSCTPYVCKCNHCVRVCC